jgi:hypothetical protein
VVRRIIVLTSQWGQPCLYAGMNREEGFARSPGGGPCVANIECRLVMSVPASVLDPFGAFLEAATMSSHDSSVGPGSPPPSAGGIAGSSHHDHGRDAGFWGRAGRHFPTAQKISTAFGGLAEGTVASTSSPRRGRRERVFIRGGLYLLLWIALLNMGAMAWLMILSGPGMLYQGRYGMPLQGYSDLYSIPGIILTLTSLVLGPFGGSSALIVAVCLTGLAVTLRDDRPGLPLAAIARRLELGPEPEPEPLLERPLLAEDVPNEAKKPAGPHPLDPRPDEPRFEYPWGKK